MKRAVTGRSAVSTAPGTVRSSLVGGSCTSFSTAAQELVGGDLDPLHQGGGPAAPALDPPSGVVQGGLVVGT
jgi:hypothetical protein